MGSIMKIGFWAIASSLSSSYSFLEIKSSPRLNIDFYGLSLQSNVPFIMIVNSYLGVLYFLVWVFYLLTHLHTHLTATLSIRSELESNVLEKKI